MDTPRAPKRPWPFGSDELQPQRQDSTLSRFGANRCDSQPLESWYDSEREGDNFEFTSGATDQIEWRPDIILSDSVDGSFFPYEDSYQCVQQSPGYHHEQLLDVQNRVQLPASQIGEQFAACQQFLPSTWGYPDLAIPISDSAIGQASGDLLTAQSVSYPMPNTDDLCLDVILHNPAVLETESQSPSSSTHLAHSLSTQSCDATSHQTSLSTVDTISPSVGSSTSNANTVCFGAIVDVKLRVSADLDDNALSALLPVPGDRPDLWTFIVARHDHFYAIQSRSGLDIGVLDIKMGNTLYNLDNIGSTSYEIVVPDTDLSTSIQHRKGKGKPIEWNGDLHVFGSQDLKDSVGESLSATRLYLQHPRYLDPHIPVDNPHMISFPNVMEHQSVSRPVTASTPHQQPERMTTKLSTLLDGLDQEEYLQPAKIDNKVTTDLKKHQRLGVNFILEREIGTPFSAFSLWEERQPGRFKNIYEHKITNKRTSEPPKDEPGGILADEMGLGKTLVMLSTILATVDRSCSFARNQQLHLDPRTQRSRATLVVAPSALLLEGWMAQVRSHVSPDALRIHKYHGGGKETNIEKLADFDIVLTTYATLATENSRDDRLHAIIWYRVVLDEAHTIRNQSTRCFRSVASLRTRIRWCLTGTPIQNKLEDLGSLVRFLRVPHLDTPVAFRNHIVQPVESGLAYGFENLRTLLKCICIRRTKEFLQLPDPQTIECKLRFSTSERVCYSKIGESYRQAIDDALSGRNTSEVYQTILHALLKLRMLCNHGTFAPTSGGRTSSEADRVLALLQDGSTPCVYCGEEAISDDDMRNSIAACLPTCSHIVCKRCCQPYEDDLRRLEEGFELKCPLCSAPIKEDVSKRGETVAYSSGNLIRDDGESTKLSRLLKDIKDHRYSDMCIVFSTWKKTLDLISALLTKHDVPFVQLDGSLSLPDRRQVLSRFQEKDVPVLLMTLGTGAVGLNLTVATRLHIVEPQWNPSIESQAIGRAVRLGQDKQVTIVRYIMQGTVEEFIQSRQSRKMQLAELGFDAASQSAEEVKLERLLELRELLGG